MRANRFPSNTAVFEIPNLVEANQLCERLRPLWNAVPSFENEDAVTFVVVLLPEDPKELDKLLGTVEEWVNASALISIRFHVDRHAYLLKRGGSIGPASV